VPDPPPYYFGKSSERIVLEKSNYDEEEEIRIILDHDEHDRKSRNSFDKSQFHGESD